MKHELKIEPAYFEAVLSGAKTFEIRYNDRGYQKGDTVILKEYNPEGPMPGYSERYAAFEIGWVTTFAQKDNWCVFSIHKPGTLTK